VEEVCGMAKKPLGEGDTVDAYSKRQGRTKDMDFIP